MSISRRHLLKGIGATTLSAATLSTLGNTLNGFLAADAAEVSGYKALVCVFLFGGADTHDMLLPYDQASYDKFAQIRSSLLNQYAGQAGGNSRARDRLLPITPTNAAEFGGRQFALPPEMSGLQGLFEEGNAAVVANTGPLITPLTRSQFNTGSVELPKQLFSHNDQQSTWSSGAPEGAQYGWGGLFADAVAASGANTNQEFTSISTLGNELFLTGKSVSPYQVSLNGVSEIELLTSFQDADISALLRRHFKAADYQRTNLIERDIAQIADRSVELNDAFNQAYANLIPISTEFPDSFLGGQMKSIANTIAIRDALFARRQVFFAGLGGFDTHSAQAADLPNYLQQVDEAVTAFYRAMQELGLDNEVTLFTASDFGRTLAVNGDGTDHGWGSHHFVIGNAVQGQAIYGTVPPPEFDHEYDAGGGRLIPTTSVEQYAEPLGRWFGLNDSELAAALPRLGNFSSKPELKSLMKAST